MFEFSAKFVNVLAWFGTTRSSIYKTFSSQRSLVFKAKYVGKLPLYGYFAFHLNSILRIFGLILLSLGFCGLELDYLATVTAIVFAACLVYIMSGISFFFYTSPLMDAVCEFWNVQNIIFTGIKLDGAVANFLEKKNKEFGWLIM